MIEGAETGIRVEAQNNQLQEDLNEVRGLLAGLASADPAEAYYRLRHVFGTAGFAIATEPESVKKFKELLNKAGCWDQIWQTEPGSEYYVLPSGVMIRWKVGMDIDFSPSGPREPTIPICFLPEDTAKAVCQASDNKITGRTLSSRPNEEKSILSVKKDQFSYARTAGVTRWEFKEASTKPEIGLAPFDFECSPAGPQITTTTSEDGTVTVEVQHQPRENAYYLR